MPTAVIRRCVDGDWADLRRLHIMLALAFPIVVDVELNEVFATPDSYWQDHVHSCSVEPHQAIFVAAVGTGCAGMGHVHLHGTGAHLSALYVDVDERRRGVGTALVAAQVAWARDGGATAVDCHIPDASPAAGMAAALGWKRTDEVFTSRHGLAERRWVSGCGTPTG